MTTAIVCGGRAYADKVTLNRELDRLAHEHGITRIVHGKASGADRLAGEWAHGRMPVIECPPDWKRLGRQAGPIRNGRMLRAYGAKLVIAFPGGAGTADMVRKAEEAGVLVVFAGRAA